MKFDQKQNSDSSLTVFPDSALSLHGNEKLFVLCSILAVGIVTNNILCFTIHLQMGYYYSFMGILFLLLLYGGFQGISFSMLMIYLACGCSLLVNDTPPFFNAWQRFFSFVLMTTLFSPFLQTRSLTTFRLKFFPLLLKVNIGICAVSFFFQLLLFGFSDWWCGATSHSMILGPLAGTVILTNLYYLNRTQNLSYWGKWGHWVSFGNGVVLLLGASSRAAIIATFCSVVFWFVVARKIKKMIVFCILLIVIGCASHSYLSPLLQKVIDKNRGESTSLSLSSRTDHWAQRLREFQANPIWGIGMGVVDINSVYGSSFDINEGRTETGSSWLSVLSMTGIVGGVAFLFLFLSLFQNIKGICKKDHCFGGFLGTLALFWFCDALGEGFVFGAGGWDFTSIWALFGYIQAVNSFSRLKAVDDEQ